MIFLLKGYVKAKESLIKPSKVNKKADATANNNIGAPGAGKFDPNEIARKEAKQKPKSQYTGGKANTPGRQNYMQKGASRLQLA